MTRAVSPRSSFPAVTSADQAARYGTPIAAASSIRSALGFALIQLAGIATYSAWTPSSRTPQPGPLPQTSIPSAASPPSTTPAKSRPGTLGKTALKCPPTFFTSLGFTAVATIRTSTSPLPGVGLARSRSARTDGGPYASKDQTLILDMATPFPSLWTPSLTAALVPHAAQQCVCRSRSVRRRMPTRSSGYRPAAGSAARRSMARSSATARPSCDRSAGGPAIGWRCARRPRCARGAGTRGPTRARRTR